jgi:hypothetical protein|tara:strand:- start:127 stop:423 length:297 start_codon:yes stop_codon:yes gene_type:complete
METIKFTKEEMTVLRDVFIHGNHKQIISNEIDNLREQLSIERGKENPSNWVVDNMSEDITNYEEHLKIVSMLESKLRLGENNFNKFCLILNRFKKTKT